MMYATIDVAGALEIGLNDRSRYTARKSEVCLRPVILHE
jgi:hypothetical protein